MGKTQTYYSGHFIDDLYKDNAQYNLINLIDELIKTSCVEEFIEDWKADIKNLTDDTIRQSERFEELLLLQSKINQFKKEYKDFFKKGVINEF
tara:strand:+ start:384 stop:662 length:279 start_codon:yes stop_codon:yes gene_type:complete